MKKRSKSKSEFQLVSANFRIRAEWKKVMSRAELKIFQLELWLEPARLGLITNKQYEKIILGTSDSWSTIPIVQATQRNIL